MLLLFSLLQAETLQTEMDTMKERVEELTLDLELLRGEISDKGDF